MEKMGESAKSHFYALYDECSSTSWWEFPKENDSMNVRPRLCV